MVNFLKLGIFYTLTTFRLKLPKKDIHKRILIAPLDWGLGHATRCVPIIKLLQLFGYEPVVAAEGTQLSLLKQEFPTLTFIHLNGYKITYTKYKRWLPLKISLQIPKILFAIQREHNWLKKIIASHEFDAVISDNRYGLYTNQVPCVFITHQLQIKGPNNWIENILQRLNYRFINRFTECWIPDFEGNLNIAGELSHPHRKPKTEIKYIGPLSRFNTPATQETIYKYIFLLSGPEPQRTLLEDKILKIVAALNDRILIVRGRPGKEDLPPVPQNCTIINHLPTNDLQSVLASGEFIISRSGYTTVMEIMALQKKSILIPTPGQTEQEYLARHLCTQGWCYTCNQEDDLLLNIKKAEEYSFSQPSFNSAGLKEIVAAFLEKV